MEGANLENSVLTNAVLEGTYFSETISKAGDISGADFTDAMMRTDVQSGLCKRSGAKDTNPTPAGDTPHSLLC
ncbi:unnamed protein product, partial [Phaeothamnion confervicola]